MHRPERGGNGCLYALAGVGVALVLFGFLIEKVLLGPDVGPPPVLTFDEVYPEPFDEPKVELPPPDFVPEPQPVEASETVRLLWHAEADDRTPCTIVLEVERVRGGIGPMRARLSCAGDVRFEGAVQGELRETPEAAGSYAYRASLDAAEAGVSFSLRSSTQSATLRDASGVRAFHVEDLSVPRRGAPFAASNAGREAAVRERLRLLAVPTRTDGDPPAAVLAAFRDRRAPPSESACELTGATVISASYPCRLILRCGGETIYGASSTGYNRCVVHDGEIVSAEDTGTTIENADPRLRLDVARDELVISDDDGTSTWSATFALSEDPRCALAGRWEGSAVDAEGTAFRWQIGDFGAEAPWTGRIAWTSATYDGLDETVVATPDCRRGRVTLTTQAVSDERLGSGRYELWFGPGFGSLVGAWEGQEVIPGELWGTRR